MIDKEAIKKDREEVREGTGEDIFWVPSPGKHRLRLLLLPNKPIFYVKKKFHYLDVGGQRKSVMCSEVDCPVCELASKLIRSGDTQGAKSLRPRFRFFSNVVPLLEQPLKVKVWGYGVTIFEELASYVEDPEWGDLVVKNDIILERVGEGIDTEYRVRVSQKSTPIPDTLLAQAFNLDEILVPRGRDYVTSLLSDTEFAELVEDEKEGMVPTCFGLFDKTDPACKSCAVMRRCMRSSVESNGDTPFTSPQKPQRNIRKPKMVEDEE